MKSCKVPHPEAISLLIEAGESVYSWDLLEVEVPGKPRKIIAICQGCGESFIQQDDEAFCQACPEDLAAVDLKPCCHPAQEEDALCPQS
jgi:formylmethanofuran dehydrogenase subunit E